MEWALLRNSITIRPLHKLFLCRRVKTPGGTKTTLTRLQFRFTNTLLIIQLQSWGKNAENWVPWEFCYLMKPPSSNAQLLSSRTTVPGELQSRLKTTKRRTEDEVPSSQTFLQLKGSTQPFDGCCTVWCGNKLKKKNHTHNLQVCP